MLQANIYMTGTVRMLALRNSQDNLRDSLNFYRTILMELLSSLGQ